MTDFLLSIEGTEAGARLAMILALTSAFAHAVFGALQKGRYDPWLTRGAIDVWIFILSAPVALFVVPWPQGFEWAILAGAMVIHFVYKVLMAMAYTRAAYTVVYPVVRGTAPFVTVLFAWIVFEEAFAPMQWLGVVCLSGGIMALALVNLTRVTLDPAALRAGLGIAFLGGLVTALYTVYDAWGIRSTPDPFTFLAWFFFLTAVDIPFIALYRYRRMAVKPVIAPLVARGFLGAVIAFISFGSVMMATRLDAVGEAAVLRETSTVFAAVIGWLVLREPVGPLRAGLMAAIAAGAVLVELGG
ncbi:MAG: EamA family transporter [Rubricella sp.]